MRFLLTLAMICTFFGVSYAQTDYRLGPDKDGVVWFTNKKMIHPVVNQRHMTAMFTEPKTTLHFAVYVEVDCSDNTIRLHGMDTFRNGYKVNSIEDKSDWATPKGLAIKLYQFVCREKATLVMM
jgi:hypothetical protein